LSYGGDAAKASQNQGWLFRLQWPIQPQGGSHQPIVRSIGSTEIKRITVVDLFARINIKPPLDEGSIMKTFSIIDRIGILCLILKGRLRKAADTLRSKLTDGQSPTNPDHFLVFGGIPKVPRSVLDGSRRLGSARIFEEAVEPVAKRVPVSQATGPRFDECNYTNDAGSRQYKLFIPSGHNGKTLPLVVMLHGCTQSPDDFAAGTQMNDLAEEQTFLVAYPAQTRSANVRRCWNWFNTAHQKRDEGEPSLIAGVTRQIMHDFPIHPGRIYIAGLSAGGAAAAIMGSLYPELYTAIGVHSGLALLWQKV
jgi:Esterase PHB depolymerase